MNNKDHLLAFLSQIPYIEKSPNGELEFEIRYLLDKRKNKHGQQTLDLSEMKLLIGKIISENDSLPSSIEQSINLIDSEQRIKQLVFIDGIQQKNRVKYYKKQHLINPIFVTGDFKYKIDLSNEIQLSETSGNFILGRIKLRYSIQFEQWRLDITLVKETDMKNPDLLKQYKDQMLFKINKDEFTARAPWNIADYIELEMEFTADLKSFTKESIIIPNTFIEKYHKVEQKTIHQSNDIQSNDGQSNDYQKTIYQIARYIKPHLADKFKHEFGMKQLGNQVIELDKNTYLKDLSSQITDYYITDKIDGKRTILYFDGDNLHAVNDQHKIISPSVEDDKNSNTRDGHTIDGHTKDDRLSSDNYAIDLIKGQVFIFDCELYEGVYYIFDIMVWKNNSIMDNTFENRLLLFQQAVALFPCIREKAFVRLDKEYREQILQMKNSNPPYETDGIILTPSNGKYLTMKVFKYKPLNKLTIDFLIKKCPDKLLGIYPYMEQTGKTLYLLFCGIKKSCMEKLGLELINYYRDIFPSPMGKYIPIQFSPSDKKNIHLYYSEKSLDGEVGEFRYMNGWELVKLRTDRKVEVQRGNYFGNNYRIAENTWLSIGNPLIIESDDNPVYFQQHESKIHQASRNFNSYVKSKIFEQQRNTKWVMDLGSGKGQDLYRYAKAQMKNLVCLEIDKTALMELISRKHEFSEYRSDDKINVQTQCIDLNMDYKQNIETINENLLLPVGGVDLLMSNFVFHYLIKDRTAINNIAKFINYYVKPGGRFIFTAFDGKTVFDLLKPTGEYRCEVSNGISNGESKEIKFHIKKKYTEEIFKDCGQQIDVLLPFSNEEYYTEYLVNISTIEKELKPHGFVLEIDQSFNEFLDSCKMDNIKLYESLDKDDILYTGLYHYYSFYKTDKSKSGGKAGSKSRGRPGYKNKR